MEGSHTKASLKLNQGKSSARTGTNSHKDEYTLNNNKYLLDNADSEDMLGSSGPSVLSLPININNNMEEWESTGEYATTQIPGGTGIDCHELIAIEHKQAQENAQTTGVNDLCIGGVRGLNIDECGSGIVQNKLENCKLQSVEANEKRRRNNGGVYVCDDEEGNIVELGDRGHSEDSKEPENLVLTENKLEFYSDRRHIDSNGNIECINQDELNLKQSEETTMSSDINLKTDAISDMQEPASVSSKHCLQKEGISDNIVPKSRRIDSGVETVNPEQIRKKSSSDKSQGKCKRHSSSSSDRESSSRPASDEITGSEDEGIFDGFADASSEPCECDECLLDAEPDKQKPEPQLRKFSIRQSSWGKIRNIIHWSPFIQHFRKRRYPWIQLAGHQGNFQAGEPGAILKKYDKKEHRSFNKLMKDKLRPYVPEYLGEAAKDGDCYLQLQDLLCEFEAPCVMDIKMGCRTYLEEELSKAREKPTLRKDMYQKMVDVDPNAPTEVEHEQKGITKPRYMKWRDDMSSSSEMGFRIEGIRKSDGAQVKNFKTTKDKKSVKGCLQLYVEENPGIIHKYLRRLKCIRATQEDSEFFKAHEVIGSSLLFVHDKEGKASIWMIDFGKTVPLPENVQVSHRNKWEEGNHEDGYLVGLDSLIEIFEELNSEFCEINRANDSETSEQMECKDSENHADPVNEINKDCNVTKETSSQSKNTTVNTTKTNTADNSRDDNSVKVNDAQANESTV